MQLHGLEEPVKPEDIDAETEKSVGVLLRQVHPNVKWSSSHRSHWRDVARVGNLFLGRDDNGKIVALGCVSLRYPMCGLIANIEEVIVDTSCRDASTERQILHRLMSWAGAVKRVDLIAVHQMTCQISEEVLTESMFKRLTPKSRRWFRVVPDDEDK